MAWRAVAPWAAKNSPSIEGTQVDWLVTPLRASRAALKTCGARSGLHSISAPSLPLMRYLKPLAVASTPTNTTPPVPALRPAASVAWMPAIACSSLAEDAVDLARVLLEEGFHDGLAL